MKLTGNIALLIQKFSLDPTEHVIELGTLIRKSHKEHIDLFYIRKFYKLTGEIFNNI
jgi:hypothetical protein